MGKGSLPIQQVRRGDVIEGTIIEISPKEALVDVGAKSEGVIPQAEIKGTNYKVGDKVLVYVLTPEDRRGQMIVSLNKAVTMRSWIDLENAYKNGETLEIEIEGHNRGGLMGTILGLPGFVPFSHSDSASDLSVEKHDLQSILDKMVGQKLKVRVIELDREKNRIILSEKEAALGEALEKRRDVVINMKVNDIVSGVVSAVMPYGLMISVNGVEGLVAREEISWDEDGIDEVLGSMAVGQEVKAQIVEIDKDLGKVKLSIKSISKNPWEEAGKKYKVNDTVTVTISRITSYGVFATLDKEIEGMVPLSSITTNEKLEVGMDFQAKIQNLDTEKRRLDLLLVSVK